MPDGAAPTAAKVLEGQSADARGAADVLDAAIAQATEQRIARLEMNLHTSSGSKPMAIELPADLTPAEAFIVIEATANACRQVIIAAEQRRNHGLVIARGSLPTP